MTEQETREKIVGIITHEYVTDKDYAYIFDPRIEEKINNMADALIAAGIGDVKIHRVFVSKDGKEVKQLYSGEEVERIAKERDEYKHRAARAERALQIADELGELCGRKEDYVQQAEKELAEERKDD